MFEMETRKELLLRLKIYNKMLQDPKVANEWRNYQTGIGQVYGLMLQKGSLTIGDKTMKFQFNVIGQMPPNGYSLIFGLHGGGACSK